ncbi:helix-turn-helix domain-containing protein [Rhizobium sp. P32RR-XVIII]|uniref:helix-turn-helix domain-containing protein n=1 Tax=Rhizobium sp. P32RR-XVIII TaxID=2726738 RepID=UPI00145647CC|nr:helix-turn-helix domain-containing protein [Rhizobium sp. P32RR-XVIII]NLS07663.1 helix-turn-helix domain-containing protein [Rhizobium sp. P32RR-XVIII]
MLRYSLAKAAKVHPRYEEIVSLHSQGLGGKPIARKLGIGKNPVYRVLNSIKNK